MSDSILLTEKKDKPILQYDIITLNHPKGYPTVYLSHDGDIYELQSSQSSPYTSWFVNQRINATRYSPLDQILKSSIVAPEITDFPLQKPTTLGLHEICDINDKFDDLILYRYNEAKTMEWLSRKVHNVSRQLAIFNKKKSSAKNQIYVETFNSGPSSHNSEGDDSIDDVEADIIEATQVISDYLEPSMTSKLVTYLNLQESEVFPIAVTQTSNKRKADWEVQLEVEKDTFGIRPATILPLTTFGVSQQSGNNEKSSCSYPGSDRTSTSKKSGVAAKLSNKSNSTKTVPAKGVQSINNFFTSSKK